MAIIRLAAVLAIGLVGFILSSCGEDETARMTDDTSRAAGGMAKTDKKTADDGSSERRFSADQEKEIGEIVRRTLLSKPEILQEAFAVLEQREREKQEKRKLSAISDNADLLFRSSLSPVAGNPKGDVTIVEFFDYNCPYCRKAFKDLEILMKEDKNLRIVFKEYPIFGGASPIAARAALAAEKQGKYFAFHKALLEEGGRLTEKTVFARARRVGLDIDRLKKDMKSADVDREIAETKRLADRLGVRGTPAFFVGDKMIPGAPRNLVELMKKHVEDIRKNGCRNC